MTKLYMIDSKACSVNLNSLKSPPFNFFLTIMYKIRIILSQVKYITKRLLQSRIGNRYFIEVIQVKERKSSYRGVAFATRDCAKS